MKVIRKHKYLEAFWHSDFEHLDGTFQFKGYDVKKDKFKNYIFSKKDFVPFVWWHDRILIVDKNNEIFCITYKEFNNEFIFDDEIKTIEKKIDIDFNSKIENINEEIIDNKFKDLKFTKCQENMYIYEPFVTKDNKKSLCIKYLKTYVDIQYLNYKDYRKSIIFENIETYESFQDSLNFILNFVKKHSF